LHTKLLLLPLVLHVLLTLYVGQKTLRARIKAVRSGQVKLHEVSTDTYAWPRRVRQLGNNFDNQFQTPMLWYGVCALIVALKLEDAAFSAMSWMFLLTRMAHSYVHITHNDVPTRMRIFLFGFAILVLMWVWFGVKLMTAT
jgi:hypothetical protein